MFRRKALVLALALVIVLGCSRIVAQNPPSSDPQALTLASQSIAALTGGSPISDVTLNGTVTWNGSGGNIGTATFKALGTGESRLDLSLTTGTRTEIRDAQTGTQIGQWINPDTSSGSIASQNCQTDAVWFFPALGSLLAGQNVVFLYIGQETRNGEAVQHVQSYVYQSSSSPVPGPTMQQLSTMDFYLDAATLLPSALTFSAYPDNRTDITIPVEIDFSSYQTVQGALIPFRVQKYFNGQLLIDASFTSAVLNSGLSLSTFAIQ